MVPLLPVILGGVAAALTAAAILYFWAQIVQFIATRFIPWVKQQMSTPLANAVEHLLLFIDKGVCLARANLRAGYEFFVRRVLGLKRRYTFKGVTQATQVSTEAFVSTDQGQVVKVVTEETIPWHELPADVRKAAMQNPQAMIEMDVKQALEAQAVQRARIEEIPLVG